MIIIQVTAKNLSGIQRQWRMQVHGFTADGDYRVLTLEDPVGFTLIHETHKARYQIPELVKVQRIDYAFPLDWEADLVSGADLACEHCGMVQCGCPSP